MNGDTITMLARSILISLGAGLVTAGWLTDEQLQGGIGAILVLAIIAWQLYVRWNTRIVNENTAQRRDVPTVSAATGKELPGPQYTGS